MTTGIYAIVCLLEKRVYVGSSKNVERRWQQHRDALQKGNHYCPRLQEDWQMLGADAFRFKLLKEADETDLIRLEIELSDKIGEKYSLYSQGTRAHWGRHPKSEAWQESMIAPDLRQRRSIEAQQRWTDPNYRHTQTQAWEARKARQEGRHPPKAHQTPSEAAKQAWSDPEYRRRHAEAMSQSEAYRNSMASPERSQKISEAQKRRWARYRAQKADYC